jgi:hypothetical protein
VRSTRGGRLPLHCTGVGKVLLAYGPQELVDSLVRTGLRRYTPQTLTRPAQLSRALNEIRRTGIAFQNEELDVGLISVAAPMTDATGTVVAAPSVVLRSSRSQLHHLTPALRTAAASASRRMREDDVRGAGADGMRQLVKADQMAELNAEDPQQQKAQTRMTRDDMHGSARPDPDAVASPDK